MQYSKLKSGEEVGHLTVYGGHPWEDRDSLLGMCMYDSCYKDKYPEEGEKWAEDL